MALSNVASNGYLLTGLAQLPPNDLDPSIYGALAPVYMALKNFDTTLELLLGVIKPTVAEAKNSTYGVTGGLKVAGINRIWVPENAATGVGDVVTLVNVAGVTKCQKANSSAGNRAIGIVTDVVDAGWKEITVGMGLITGIFAGLTPGQTYWLSTATSGAIQNATVGITPQIVGMALDANNLWMQLMGQP
jgi:hypothetical protein